MKWEAEVPARLITRDGDDMNARLTVEQIARRLNVGRQTVYAMLEQGIVPGIRLGQRWLVTKHAYEEWERNCGKRCTATGLPGGREVGC